MAKKESGKNTDSNTGASAKLENIHTAAKSTAGEGDYSKGYPPNNQVEFLNNPNLRRKGKGV